MNKKEHITSIWNFFQKIKHNPSAEEVSDFLGESVEKNEIPEKNPRFSEDEYWRKKYTKKGFFWARILRFLPFVRGIALCNSLAMGNAEKKSDIDLLIVTATGRMWTARIFVTILCHILGIRRHGKKVAGRLCLSFFLSEDALTCENFALKPKDPYLAFWVSSLQPIFGREIFKKMAKENQDFAKENGNIVLRFEKQLSKIPKNGESFLEKMLGEKFEQWIQKKWKPKTLAKYEQLADKSGTVISEKMLKFHNSDQREKFL